MERLCTLSAGLCELPGGGDDTGLYQESEGPLEEAGSWQRFCMASRDFFNTCSLIPTLLSDELFGLAMLFSSRFSPFQPLLESVIYRKMEQIAGSTLALSAKFSELVP